MKRSFGEREHAYNLRKIRHIKRKYLSKDYDTNMPISKDEYQFLKDNIKNTDLIVLSKSFDKIDYGWGVNPDNSKRPTKLNGKLTRHWLLENFLYEPETGHLIYLRHRNPKKIGKPVTALQTAGYPYITVNGKNYLVHRCAWLIMTGSWPEKWIDHINGVRDDNRWCNLRQASHQNNLRYRPAPKDNTSGYKNIHFRYTPVTRKIRYTVVISIKSGPYQRKNVIIKRFKVLEDALEYRDEQLIKHFGEFAYLDYPKGHPKHIPFQDK